jgi:hypothetical protein
MTVIRHALQKCPSVHLISLFLHEYQSLMTTFPSIQPVCRSGITFLFDLLQQDSSSYFTSDTDDAVVLGLLAQRYVFGVPLLDASFPSLLKQTVTAYMDAIQSTCEGEGPDQINPLQDPVDNVQSTDTSPTSHQTKSGRKRSSIAEQYIQFLLSLVQSHQDNDDDGVKMVVSFCQSACRIVVGTARREGWMTKTMVGMLTEGLGEAWIGECHE